MRLQLASILKAVVSQRLMPRANGQGRIAAVEVMIATPFIRDCILDKDKTHSILGAIAPGTSQYGMQTFDQSIFGHFQKGIISYDDALRYATNQDEFKLKVQGISTTSEMARDQMLQASRGEAEIVRFGTLRARLTSLDGLAAALEPRRRCYCLGSPPAYRCLRLSRTPTSSPSAG